MRTTGKQFIPTRVRKAKVEVPNKRNEDIMSARTLLPLFFGGYNFWLYTSEVGDD